MKKALLLSSLPFWKLKREIRRLLHQAMAVPGALMSRFFSTYFYDLVLARNSRISDGDVPLDARVAIYLVFPQHGLLGSHKEALRYLISCGYAPLVISNLPLSEPDRHELSQHCWKIIERPNYGYDFGGYRDGILFLREHLGRLEKLAILNDSTWFPIPGSQSWLKRAEDLNMPFVGAASNYGLDRVNVADYLSIRWRYSAEHKNFHYCSYALLISQPLLSAPSFQRYWKQLWISGSKGRTVRRGEIGLTQWVIRNGYAHDVTLSLNHLNTELAYLPDERVRLILERLIIPEDPRLLAIKKVVVAKATQAAADWRQHAENFILTAVARQGVSYALPEYTLNELGFQFLKKSPTWLNRESSDTTLEIASSLEGPFAETIVSEIKALRLKLT
ncbi:hypothetical protein ASD50_16335 [Mesorhizobium sp. Root552]|uniref:rhamnan synthesis F family protein n=1 Tax=Mesorhizobium sp. Root552 TaxID=1736555 RepID=UPI0006FA0B1C|nr:rhamnan synthesis F family protein [Mesorhizobium sp. Root552]KQZ31091.1 hypothetical protein ASD50_16335 [Mesorhizobium sp. Root552]